MSQKLRAPLRTNQATQEVFQQSSYVPKMTVADPPLSVVNYQRQVFSREHHDSQTHSADLQAALLAEVEALGELVSALAGTASVGPNDSPTGRPCAIRVV